MPLSQGVQAQVPVHGELLHLLPGHLPPPQPGQVLHQGILSVEVWEKVTCGKQSFVLIFSLSMNVCRWTATMPAPSTSPSKCPRWTGSTGPWPWQATVRGRWRRRKITSTSKFWKIVQSSESLYFSQAELCRQASLGPHHHLHGHVSDRHHGHPLLLWYMWKGLKMCKNLSLTYSSSEK